MGEEIKALGKRISSMRVSEDVEINENSKIDNVFNQWLIDEHLKKKFKISYSLHRLFELIKIEQDWDDTNTNINEMSVEAIKFLDNPIMYEFLNGQLDIDKFIDHLYAMNVKYEDIDDYIRN